MNDFVKQKDESQLSNYDAARQLAELILNGSASEQERGVFLQTIQTAMGAGLLSQMQRMHSIMMQGMDMYKKLDSEYLKHLDEDLASGALAPDEIALERDGLEKRMLTLLELERKVMQGKSLFPEDTLSSDDRKVLRILNTIKTPEDRDRFFNLLDSFLTGNNSFDEPIRKLGPDEV